MENPEDETKKDPAGTSVTPSAAPDTTAGLIAQMQKQMFDMEKRLEEESLARAGLEEIVATQQGASENGAPLRERKTREPKFRTLRLREFPIGGDFNNKGIVIGWTNRGAYQEVDKTGLRPEIVDYIDIFFLDHDAKPEKVRLLDLLNNGVQKHYKIKSKNETKDVKILTGEEIEVTAFDDAHGTVGTGEMIDGFVGHSDITYTIEIPGHADIEIDQLYVN